VKYNQNYISNKLPEWTDHILQREKHHFNEDEDRKDRRLIDKTLVSPIFHGTRISRNLRKAEESPKDFKRD